jgi:hypothetical protein
LFENARLDFIKKFATHYAFFTPEELEQFIKKVYAILIKYKNAISKYCAYSNIESIKFLMTYGSKKTLILWNYIDGGVDHSQFKTKGEMLESITHFQTFYDGCVENTFVSTEPPV